MKAMQKHFAILFILVFLSVDWPGIPLRAESVVKDKDRIIFCGDSITAQGGLGGANGWVGLIGEGLATTHAPGAVSLTFLGASGCTVGAWQNIEKKSRDKPEFLDAKTIDVKATLDGGAEIVVIMLGMNDLLSPAIKDTPAEFDAWAVRYRTLIDTLRARVKPRLFALATITPCGENPDSPKNRAEAELNTRLAALAKDEGAIVLPTHEASMEFQQKGRAFRPDFRITRDYVHPGAAGHLAIAVGMLRGLGETDAANNLMAKHSVLFTPAAETLPTLSYTVKTQAGSPDEAKHNFTIHYQWTPAAGATGDPTLTPTAPEGWTISPATMTATQGDFTATGPLDHLENTILLDAVSGDVKREEKIVLPATWRIATGKGAGLGWIANTTFDPVKDTEALDTTLLQDSAWLTPITFVPGGAATWQSYQASPDFTGVGAPGSVDMAAVNFFTYHDVAYGARWIHSDTDRAVDVTVSTQAFATMSAVKVWMNGDSLYQGKPSTEPGKKKTVEAKLQKGWNRLWFKASFVQWQWQFSIDLAGKTGDALDDLRYATMPPH